MNKGMKRKGGKVKGKGNKGGGDEIDENTEIELLRSRVVDEAPEIGSQPSKDESNPLKFNAMPLSRRTIAALTNAKLGKFCALDISILPPVPLFSDQKHTCE